MRETTKQKEQREAIEHLRKVLKPGDKVYGIVRTVSRSGMSRTIDFYTFAPNECECTGANHEPWCRGDVIDRAYLSGWIATALDYRRTNQGALKVQGCGMDMIFHVVYNLSRTLFPEGFGIPCDVCGLRPRNPEDGKRRQASIGFTQPQNNLHRCSYRGRNGDRSGWDEDGGYALKHEQL